MEPTDKDFVFDSWLKSWRTQRVAGVIPNNLYFDTMRATIENLVARGSTITIACDVVDNDRIYGWICWELTPDKIPVVHYLYVKDVYLRYDVDKVLMAEIKDMPFITFAYDQVKRAVDNKFGKSKGWVPAIARRK